jgi:hypothetical protein
VKFSHLDRSRHCTPRPGAVKGAGFALAAQPLTARRARGAVLLDGRGEKVRYSQRKERLFLPLVSVRLRLGRLVNL